MPASQLVDVDGRRLRLTNLDKVLYPETGTTKAEIIHYYASIAPALLPHLAARPVTRKRWPDGVGTAAAPVEAFFEKDLGAGVPDWVLRQAILHSGGAKRYPVVADRATLVWLAQSAALELHVPQWRFDTEGRPTRMVLDFDPGAGAGLRECAQVALWAKDILNDMGLPTFPVTSGSKGIHVYVPLDGRLTSDQVSAVAHELARALEADHPDEVVSTMPKARRVGKVFVDWSQNNGKKTTVSPYSLRGVTRPLAAAPRSWDEIADPSLAQLTFTQVLDRYEKDGDLLAGLDLSPAVSPPEALRAHIDLGLAKAAERLPEPSALPGGSRYEPKLDGWRAATVVDKDRVVIWSRQKTDLTDSFPDVAAAVAAQTPSGVVLDGELVRWHDGRLDFDALQRRFASGKARLARLIADEPIDYVVFDVLAAGGRDVRGLPYDERRRILEQVTAGWVPPLSVVDVTSDATEARRWFDELPEEHGIEGLVVKGGSQPYRGGHRDWVKVKRRDTFEVVAGAVTGSLTQPGELILGRYENGVLRIIGRTTPIKAAAAKSLTPLLRPAGPDHPWPTTIRSSTYDRFSPKRDTRLTLIEPVTVEISADTAVVGGTIRHAARFVRARPETNPEDID